MASSGLQGLTLSHVEELSRLRLLLHLLFHRNKNQHRSSAWWRFFAGFRRELGRFLEEVAKARILDGPALSRKEKQIQKEMRERIEKRLRLWRDILVEKWYLSFSQLIASKQFSTLGLVLLASLARVCLVTGITAVYQQMATPEVQDEARRIATEDPNLVVDSVSRAADASSSKPLEDDNDEAMAGYGDEDVGEVVARDAGNEDERLRMEQDAAVFNPTKKDGRGTSEPRHARVTDSESKMPGDKAFATGSAEGQKARARKGTHREGDGTPAKTKSAKEKERPKKKRKKNAIDDIFGF